MSEVVIFGLKSSLYVLYLIGENDGFLVMAAAGKVVVDNESAGSSHVV